MKSKYQNPNEEFLMQRRSTAIRDLLSIISDYEKQFAAFKSRVEQLEYALKRIAYLDSPAYPRKPIAGEFNGIATAYLKSWTHEKSTPT